MTFDKWFDGKHGLGGEFRLKDFCKNVWDAAKQDRAPSPNTANAEIADDMLATVQGCSDMMDSQIKARILSWVRQLRVSQ